MPRSSTAGPVPDGHKEPEYFSSLSALEDYFTAPRQRRQREAPPPPSYAPSTAYGAQRRRQGKTVVCHDYKGGFRPDDERDYTFQQWDKIDTFIYFSHHRVSPSPSGWIRAAHTNGTKILGTLIFEHEAGQDDILSLLLPPSPSSRNVESLSEASTTHTNPFSRLSMRFADYLVQLAIERGFEGWLVNVEVELGIGRERRWKREHATALVEWLRYLRGEMERKVVGGEVMWYDAVTTEGNLCWQNSLTPLNLPFFHAVSSIFINYWWRPDSLTSTAALLASLGLDHRRKDVFWGIDVFGRGTYGGGGFESWRAVQAIQAPLSSAPSADKSDFSTALFAPGYTVEASSLSHSLTSPSSYQKWLADDTYLWSHGPPTPSIAIESSRLDRERKEQRGLQRARQLAAALSPTATPVPVAYRTLPPFDYHGPLESLPGTGPRQPLSFFLPSRPTPCPRYTFYTNFSTGSGHAFFVSGEKVLHELDGDGKGWTDAGFAFTQPALVFSGREGEEEQRTKGIEVEWTEEDAWEGSRALRVSVGAGARRGTGGRGEGGQVEKVEVSEKQARVSVPLCAVDYALPPAFSGAGREAVTVEIEVRWRPLDSVLLGKQTVLPELALAPFTSNASGLRVASSPTSSVKTMPAPSDLETGWHRTAVLYTISPNSPPANSATLHVSLSLPSSCSILVGSLSITPSSPSSTPAPDLEKEWVVGSLDYSRQAQEVTWETELELATPTSTSLSATPGAPPSSFSHFHLFLRRRSASSPSSSVSSNPASSTAEETTTSTSNSTYLGTTFSHFFPLSPTALSTFQNSARQKQEEIVELLVLPIKADGSIGTVAQLRLD
ncbi:hypothetical protein JCM11641_003624 [Rhodosporidiobolus odoratus]